MNRKSKILLFVIYLFGTTLYAQTDYGVGNFYDRSFGAERKALLREPVRGTDVIWETTIWRVIDFRERFNQFFYYPYEEEGIEGRKNLAYTIWDAILDGEITVFEDDEFKRPIDNEVLKKRYTVIDTLWLEIEDEEGITDYQAVIVPKEFSSEYIFQLKVKEVWYLDKELSDFAVQIIGIAFVMQDVRADEEGDLELRGDVTLFWVPLMSQKVKKLLANRYVYRDYNLANLPSWEEIFYTRYFNSFIIREDNRHNTYINDYFLGVDALNEAERIEDAIFEFEDELWEY
ncbi:MAG: gliding motility protein GldN [Bacteroidales bacterium]|nr:gliding motility protein GldN [Bacteroidales bacterium]